MAPSTPQYHAVPSTPSTVDTAGYSSSTSTPAGGRRQYSEGVSRPSLLGSPLPRGLRFRPIPLVLSFMILAILAGSFIHPTPRSYIADYIPTYSSYQSSSKELISNVLPPSGGIPDSAGIPLTLEARLHHLLSRPALWQWEAELPSRHACPFYTFNRNTYFFHDGKPEQWEQITPTDVKRYRTKLVDYLKGVEREGGKLVWEEGMDAAVPVDQRRGLIYTAGDGVSARPGI